eukprot:gene6955-4921_t
MRSQDIKEQQRGGLIFYFYVVLSELHPAALERVYSSIIRLVSLYEERRCEHCIRATALNNGFFHFGLLLFYFVVVVVVVVVVVELSVQLIGKVLCARPLVIHIVSSFTHAIHVSLPQTFNNSIYREGRIYIEEEKKTSMIPVGSSSLLPGAPGAGNPYPTRAPPPVPGTAGLGPNAVPPSSVPPHATSYALYDGLDWVSPHDSLQGQEMPKQLSGGGLHHQELGNGTGLSPPGIPVAEPPATVGLVALEEDVRCLSGHSDFMGFFYQHIAACPPRGPFRHYSALTLLSRARHRYGPQGLGGRLPPVSPEGGTEKLDEIKTEEEGSSSSSLHPHLASGARKPAATSPETGTTAGAFASPEARRLFSAIHLESITALMAAKYDTYSSNKFCHIVGGAGLSYCYLLFFAAICSSFFLFFFFFFFFCAVLLLPLFFSPLTQPHHPFSSSSSISTNDAPST